MKKQTATTALILTPAIVITLSIFGCKNGSETNVTDIIKGSNTWVVTVGMENSRFAGSCPGAALDASRMTNLLSAYSDHVTAFSSETATKAAVVEAMKVAVNNAELFVFFYSGHGGSTPTYSDAHEADGNDEFLCLYDTWLLDNEIWNLIKDFKGRFWMINDCCHSKTMFRMPRALTLGKFTKTLKATSCESGAVNMQCWSGCPDNTYSYGSSSGGKFTNAFLNHFSSAKTYEDLWREIESDEDLKKSQLVQRTLMGNSFTDRQVCR